MRSRAGIAAAIIAAILPLAGAALAHDHGKPAVAEAATPHMDHTPKHGGVFFMAPDGFHHLEGAYERPGVVRVYMYDDYSKPIRAVGFTGDASMSDSPSTPSVPLREAGDGTLEASFPLSRFPASVDVWIGFPAKNGKPASREVFTFVFDGFSDATVSDVRNASSGPN